MACDLLWGLNLLTQTQTHVTDVKAALDRILWTEENMLKPLLNLRQILIDHIHISSGNSSISTACDLLWGLNLFLRKESVKNCPTPLESLGNWTERKSIRPFNSFNQYATIAEALACSQSVAWYKSASSESWEGQFPAPGNLGKSWLWDLLLSTGMGCQLSLLSLIPIIATEPDMQSTTCLLDTRSWKSEKVHCTITISFRCNKSPGTAQLLKCLTANWHCIVHVAVRSWYWVDECHVGHVTCGVSVLTHSPSFQDWHRHWLSETSHHVVFPRQTRSIPASARESFWSQNTCQN